MIDLTEEQKLMLETVRRIAAKELEPRAAELDEKASPSQRKQNVKKAVEAMLETFPTEADIKKVMEEKSKSQ